MKRKRNMKHPNFILGLVSYLLLLAGVALLSVDAAIGRPLVLASFIAGGIHWAGSIVDVSTDPNLKHEESRGFWLALVIMVPPLAGMIYYMVDGRRFSY